MLNAKSMEKLAPSISPASEVGASSFGMVLDSVQGLQQRLVDLSVDEISEAEALARTLISRLTELTKKLDRLTEVQRSVAAARRSATQGRIENIEIPDLKVLENSLPVHAIVQASNLIPFPRPKKALSEIDENLPLTVAPIIYQPESLKSAADGNSDNREKTNDFDLEDQARNLEEAVAPELTRGQMFATHPEGTEAPILPAAMSIDSTVPQEDFPSHASEEELASSEISKIFAQDFTPLPEIEATELLANAPTFEFAKNEESAAEAKREEAASAAFDQRLLDDLIKNYGEFASPATSIPVEPPTTPSRPAHAQAVRRESRRHEPESLEQSVPNLTKKGQLDRELKKIIKDYGEVDLYSRQRSINLKTAGIAAFLLLGALVAGFYFFYSPNTTSVGDVPETTSTAAPSQIGSGSSKEFTDKREKISEDRNGTAGELDRNIESGKSQ
jgi:chemotaxis protein histidine kinase CheA